METYFENIPIFAYLNYYLYLEFADDTATICSAEMDFSKPLTQEVFDSIANSLKKFYEKQGKTVVAAKFVTKEAYEQFEKTFDGDPSITVSWNENGTNVK